MQLKIWLISSKNSVPCGRVHCQKARKFAVKRLSGTSSKGVEEFKNQDSLTANFNISQRLKAGNILPDNEMNPKISDFGMARACKKCMGNVQLWSSYSTNHKSGKRTSSYYGPCEDLKLLEYAYELWRHGEGMKFFDSTLDDSSSPWKLIRCKKVALLCVQENPADRPTMLEILTMLKNETAAIKTPKKPAFSVKREEDEESDGILQVTICSVNDASITQRYRDN
ncbi:cysteine-rich receptor-like protein kinase 10 [Melia azedarach]|uniref:Cysteine-rich receptor-like protein kinase 10 n=1 Tax=Melia azedarach TaxID=155640 RepID=A0ACC1XET2_MELAZ|nr:cysteine-rich receptor-like protein kinase 10 [Melia azedarach]